MPLFNFADPEWARKNWSWAHWWAPRGMKKPPAQSQPPQIQPSNIMSQAMKSAFGQNAQADAIRQMEETAPSYVQQALYGMPGAYDNTFFSNAPAPQSAQDITQNALSQYGQQADSTRQSIGNLANDYIGNMQDIANTAQSQMGNIYSKAMQGAQNQGQQLQNQVSNLGGQYQQQVGGYGDTMRQNVGNVVNNTMQQAQNVWGNQPAQIDLNQAKQQAEASINRNLIRQQRQAARALADTMGARGIAGSGVQAGLQARQAADIGRQMADTQANLADKYTQLGLQQRAQDINMYGMKGNALSQLLGAGMGAQTGAEQNIYGTQAGAAGNVFGAGTQAAGKIYGGNLGLLSQGMGLQGGQLNNLTNLLGGAQTTALGLRGGLENSILANQAAMLRQGMGLEPAMSSLQQEAYYRPLHEAMGLQGFKTAQQQMMFDNAMRAYANDKLMPLLLSLGPQYAGPAASLIGSAYGNLSKGFQGLMNYAAAQASRPQTSGGGFGFGLNAGPLQIGYG